ncbi:hypothetical protein U1Q18_036881 [Sarracenia purpurea var. burkii]
MARLPSSTLSPLSSATFGSATHIGILITAYSPIQVDATPATGIAFSPAAANGIASFSTTTTSSPPSQTAATGHASCYPCTPPSPSPPIISLSIHILPRSLDVNFHTMITQYKSRASPHRTLLTKSLAASNTFVAKSHKLQPHALQPLHMPHII